MERLSPQAEQILAYLQKTAIGEAYDVEALFHQWDNYVQRISFFNRYPDMTDHGRPHANNVVGLVAQLALPVRGRANGRPVLNPSETFCLTAAAWLHDIGMYTTGDTDDEDVYDAMTIRKKHSGLSRDRMREESHIIFPDVPMADVHIFSAIAAYHQSRTVLDEKHRRALLDRNPEADLVRDMPTLDEELVEQGWNDGNAALSALQAASPKVEPERIRVKLLAALLRVLDQCDIQMNRAGNLDFLLRRVDRSLQQQKVYEKLLEVIPADRDGGLRCRVEGEVEFFRKTLSFYFKDFWVEKTFIVDGKIIVKLNSEEHIRRQLGLTPSSLSRAMEIVQEQMRALDLSTYYQHANDYVRKELDVVMPYLREAGLTLEVSPYPSEGKEKRKLQVSARRRAAYRDPAPDRPPEWAEPTGVGIAAHAVFKDARALVIYGPPGRGKKQFARALATDFLQRLGEGDHSGTWWHCIERGPQIREAVRSAARYLASQTDFALENVFHDESLVTQKHVDFCIEMLAAGEQLRVVVLQDLNLIEDRYRWFFGKLIQGLPGKLVIATTTRWTMDRNVALLYGSLSGTIRYLECPRLSKETGMRLFERLARKARTSDDSTTQKTPEAWACLWHSWGREAIFFDHVATHAWMVDSAPNAARALLDASMKSHFSGIWERLADRRLWAAALRFGTDGSSAETVLPTDPEPTSDVLDLLDRGLARWEASPGLDPWQADDTIALRVERPKPTGAAWLHPGIRHLLATAPITT